MKRAMIVAFSAALVLPLFGGTAEALSSSTARKICVDAAAKEYSVLAGNVQVDRVVRHKSGYEVNLTVRDNGRNCMLTSSGKVRYLN
jgi:hypothetical protein